MAERAKKELADEKGRMGPLSSSLSETLALGSVPSGLPSGPPSPISIRGSRDMGAGDRRGNRKSPSFST